MMNANEDHRHEGSGSRALVAVGVSQPRAFSVPRRAAAFIAQLIATREHAPQTRVNRRAEPAEAIARYRAMAEMLR